VVGKLLYPEKFIKIFGPLRIIYRMLSIIINVKRFMELFIKFKNYDKELYIKLKTRKLMRFPLLSMSNDLMNVSIPMEKFMRFGWQLL
jgi:hypothetical protein